MNPLDWINRSLIGEPLNWGIVFLFATIALLGFHYVMTGFTAMQQGNGTVPQAPGSGQSIPAISSTGMPFATNVFTDDREARYAEDGWNYA